MPQVKITLVPNPIEWDWDTGIVDDILMKRPITRNNGVWIYSRRLDSQVCIPRLLPFRSARKFTGNNVCNARLLLSSKFSCLPRTINDNSRRRVDRSLVRVKSTVSMSFRCSTQLCFSLKDTRVSKAVAYPDRVMILVQVRWCMARNDRDSYL